MTPARRVLVIGLLFCLTLSGCFGKKASTRDDDGSDPDREPVTGLALPAWQIGDWWTYSSDGIEGGGFTLAVAGDTAQDWIIDTDNRDMAFFDERFDISNLGPQRKSDLAGSQGAQRVQFFQWPLTDLANWTTKWDGVDVTIQAHDLGDGKFHLKADSATGPYASYTYDNATRWVTQWTFYNADGAEQFKSTLQSSGTGFAGTLVRWNLVVAVEEHGPFPTGRALNVEVPTTITDVYMIANLTCTQGAIAIAFGPLNQGAADQGYETSGACPLTDNHGGVLATAPAEAETWGYAASSAPGATTGRVDLTVWLRTALEFKVGAGPPAGD